MAWRNPFKRRREQPTPPSKPVSVADREWYEVVLADIFAEADFSAFAKSADERMQEAHAVLQSVMGKTTSLEWSEAELLSSLGVEGLLSYEGANQVARLNQHRAREAKTQLDADKIHPTTATLKILVPAERVGDAKQILSLVFKSTPLEIDPDRPASIDITDQTSSKSRNKRELRYNVTQPEMAALQDIVHKHPHVQSPLDDPHLSAFLSVALEASGQGKIGGGPECDPTFYWVCPRDRLAARQAEAPRRALPPGTGEREL
jgi:hypothetical protein